MDEISVIVPVYNCAGQLERCLESLLAQSCERLQIVAVDDGSTDGSWEVLQRCARNHPTILAIHKENGGVTSARLAGINASRGEWIGFVDADDTVEPDMYAHLIENARAENADISHCGHAILFPDGRTEYRHNTGKKYVQDRDRGLRELLDGGQIDSSLCSKLFRRELFDGVEEWMDPAIKNGEDMMMNYYLFSRAQRAVYEDFCPYHYILREGSASCRKLNEHVVFDPVLVRQRILAVCGDALRRDARSALLRYLLFVYAMTTQQPKKESAAMRARAKDMLREQREHFLILSLRNRILANMICYVPWAFCLAYNCYTAIFERQQQH